MSIGWDNREYEDPEMDAMREDAYEACIREAIQQAKSLADKRTIQLTWDVCEHGVMSLCPDCSSLA
jgi:uncharacterized protein YggE